MEQSKQQPTNLISLSGRIGSGKDTVGTIIQYLLYKKTINKIVSTVPNIGPKGDLSTSFDTFKDEFTSVGREDWSGWKVKKFAYKLKLIASILTGIPVEKFEDQEFKKQLMGEEWIKWTVSWKNGDDGPGSASFLTEEDLAEYVIQNFEDSYEDVYDRGAVKKSLMTYREFLQLLGTEGIRNTIHPDAWVNALFADYKPYKREPYLKSNGAGLLQLPNAYFHKECKSCRKEYIGYKRQYRCADCIQIEGDIYPNWIIPDTRFPNEAEAIKSRGGVMVRVLRHSYRYDYITSEHIWSTDFNEEEYVVRVRAAKATKEEALRILEKEVRENGNRFPGLHLSETALDDYKFDYTIDNSGGTIEDLIPKVEEMLKDFKII